MTFGLTGATHECLYHLSNAQFPTNQIRMSISLQMEYMYVCWLFGIIHWYVAVEILDTEAFRHLLQINCKIIHIYSLNFIIYLFKILNKNVNKPENAIVTLINETCEINTWLFTHRFWQIITQLTNICMIIGQHLR